MGLQAVNTLPVKISIRAQVLCLLDRFLLTLPEEWTHLGEMAHGGWVIRWVMVKAASQMHTLGLEAIFPNPFSESCMKKPQAQDSSQKQWFSSPYEILDGCLMGNVLADSRGRCGSQQSSRANASKTVGVWVWIWTTPHTVGHLLLSTGCVRARGHEGNLWKVIQNDVPAINLIYTFLTASREAYLEILQRNFPKNILQRDISYSPNSTKHNE